MTVADEPLTQAQVQQAEANAATDGYLHRDLVALDQDVNVDTGGMPDETISSRVRRISDGHPKWGWNPGVWLAKALSAGLNLIQANHGAKAEAGDLQRAQRVEQVEGNALQITEAKTEERALRE